MTGKDKEWKGEGTWTERPLKEPRDPDSKPGIAG